ncbi:hypothetical protein R6Z07M_004798 [Ovis aries]
MKIEDNTLVFIVDTKVNKHQIKQPMKKLCHTDVAKRGLVGTAAEAWSALRRGSCPCGSPGFSAGRPAPWPLSPPGPTK